MTKSPYPFLLREKPYPPYARTILNKDVKKPFEKSGKMVGSF